MPLLPVSGRSWTQGVGRRHDSPGDWRDSRCSDRALTEYSQTDFTCPLRSASVWTSRWMCTEVSRNECAGQELLKHVVKSLFHLIHLFRHVQSHIYSCVILSLYVHHVASIMQHVHWFNIDTMVWDLILPEIWGFCGRADVMKFKIDKETLHAEQI